MPAPWKQSERVECLYRGNSQRGFSACTVVTVREGSVPAPWKQSERVQCLHRDDPREETPGMRIQSNLSLAKLLRKILCPGF